MKMYVGNLSRDVSEADLRQEFLHYGNVTSISVAKDRNSGQSRGFAFVEMETRAEGEAAIKGLRGKILKNHILDVTELHPQVNNWRSSGRYERKGGGGRRRRF